jgi:hypothetical protein
MQTPRGEVRDSSVKYGPLMDLTAPTQCFVSESVDILETMSMKGLKNELTRLSSRLTLPGQNMVRSIGFSSGRQAALVAALAERLFQPPFNVQLATVHL